jgi:hypothetical protein
MKNLWTISAAMLVVATVANAAEAPTAPPATAPAAPLIPKADLTMNECLKILRGLRGDGGSNRGLDGYLVISNAGKPNETVVPQTYRFSNPNLRMDIGQDIARLSDIPNVIEKTRQQIFLEVAKSDLEINPSTPQMADYNKQLVLLGESPCRVTLIHIKASDLKLDVNEIPGSVLGDIDKILDR